MVDKSTINYSDYILKNPLYIHNHTQYYEQTLNNLNKINPEERAKTLFDRYITLLQNREEDIIKRLGGGKSGEDALKKMADEAFVTNNNIKEIIKKLDEIFYMNKDIKTSVYRKDNGEVYLRLTGKGQGKKRQLLAETQLILSEIEKVRAHGRDVNSYNYEASAKIINNNMKNALLNIVQDIQNAIGTQEQLNDEISKLVNTSQLSKELTEGPLGRYVVNAQKINANSSTEELLKFIVDKLGIYIALKGQFTEASEIEFTSGIKDIFGENFQARRNDIRTHEERQGTFKKPDLTLSGGKIDADLNPITVSMKTISKNGKIKVQNSPLMGANGGIFQAIAKDDPQLANLYLYLMINSAYHQDKGNNIIELINKYISYIFISGNFYAEFDKIKELPVNQALYLVINEGSGNNINTSFIPISNILLDIVEDKKSIRMTNTKKSTADLNSSNLWGAKIYSLSKDYNGENKSFSLKYENLHDKQLVIDTVKNIADSLLTRDRKVEINYTLNEGIISRRR